jgi:hypothetical protein
MARIAVLDNRRYNDHTGRNAAFFTYFDVPDDAEAARGVLDAAAGWAAERGRTTLLGPKGFVRSDAPGLLVEGFEYEAALAMPYNYDYYPRLLEANVKSLGDMNMLGVIWHKRHRVYRRTIAGPDAGER